MRFHLQHKLPNVLMMCSIFGVKNQRLTFLQHEKKYSTYKYSTYQTSEKRFKVEEIVNDKVKRGRLVSS